MIRPLNPEDIDDAVSIWYLASIKAHHFITEEFWSSQKQSMRDMYLPNCESYVYEMNNRIVGFISYYDGSIPAIFVDPNVQSQGVGTQLLNHLKQKYKKLTLTVYCENDKTHQFYLRHDFVDIKESICQHTGHNQFEMHWQVEN